ncbi:glycosyl hydrolase family 28-related protein [Caenispirillum bisanense]|uniref:Pectate lyase superfamily protein n=1 Tax=Caenispirillum bisanense TaxID=414052 RepID=A0A286GD35_9PROT|nr:glycosyl hydrolase family 28-related protein [Caenispirillum bisanense]SOD93427.1 Pectate lyase superfamily protein [Caenispirillum bisanense]
MTPPPIPPGPTRRALLAAATLTAGGAVLPAAATAATPVADAPPPGGWPSLADFGAVGDGRTDDRTAVQAALDWAGERPGSSIRVPDGLFGLGGPLLVPDKIEIVGLMPGSGNSPMCGFRALPGFASDLVQRYRTREAEQSLPVAALLVSREWVAGKDFAGRLHIRDLFLDVDGQVDGRGAPIHGMMLTNQKVDADNVWIRHATGFGLWINAQLPDGTFVKPIVDSVLRRVWVRGAGIGDATYTTDHGTFRFGGFQIGALAGARDPDGEAEPALATDGTLDGCTVATGPEDDLGCRGDAIHITQAAGWRVIGCHVNGAGRNALLLRKAYHTEVTGNYLDGWAVAVDRNEGLLAAVSCPAMISLAGDAEGTMIVGANRIRARKVGATTGNRFAALSLRAGVSGTPRCVVFGNTMSRRRDAAHPFGAFDFSRAGGGSRDNGLEAVVVGNAVAGGIDLFLDPWDEGGVAVSFSGNNFQTADAPPTAGWHPKGLRIDNAHPAAGGWGGWVNVAAGKPGTWKGSGRIES